MIPSSYSPVATNPSIGRATSRPSARGATRLSSGWSFEPGLEPEPDCEGGQARPKIYLTDTGVAAALLAKDATALVRPTEPAAGALFETFIANELSKQLTWNSTPARLYHFRDSDGAEIDLVLEAGDGRVMVSRSR